jgi:hypothetical protein
MPRKSSVRAAATPVRLTKMPIVDRITGQA